MWLIDKRIWFRGTIFHIAVGMRLDSSWLTKFLFHGGLGALTIPAEWNWWPTVMAFLTVLAVELEQGWANRYQRTEFQYFGIGDMLFGTLGGLTITVFKLI